MGTSNNRIGILEVSSGAVVNIQSGSTLVLDGRITSPATGTSDLHTINGMIVLEASTSKLELSSLTGNQTLVGTGAIKGEDESAQFRIQGGFTLTSQMLVKGMLIIQSTSGSTVVYKNKRNSASSEGRLVANDHGTLELDPTVELQDQNSGGFRPSYEALDYDDARLLLNCQILTTLEGDFFVDGGANCDTSIEFDDFVSGSANVVTNGSLSFLGNGKIVAVNGASFDDGATYVDSNNSPFYSPLCP
jgi:hypothetical protein